MWKLMRGFENFEMSETKDVENLKGFELLLFFTVNVCKDEF